MPVGHTCLCFSDLSPDTVSECVTHAMYGCCAGSHVWAALQWHSPTQVEQLQATASTWTVTLTACNALASHVTEPCHMHAFPCPLLLRRGALKYGVVICM
jgi:hypothetical protein